MFPRAFAKQDLRQKWWALSYFLRNTVLKLTNFASFTLFFKQFFPFTAHIRIIWQNFFLLDINVAITHLHISFPNWEENFGNFHRVHKLAEIWGVFPFEVSLTDKYVTLCYILISYTLLCLFCSNKERQIALIAVCSFSENTNNFWCCPNSRQTQTGKHQNYILMKSELYRNNFAFNYTYSTLLIP